MEGNKLVCQSIAEHIQSDSIQPLLVCFIEPSLLVVRKLHAPLCASVCLLLTAAT
jgi:hypothetical protein